MKTITSLTMSRTLRGPKYHCYDCDYVLPTRLSMNTHMKMHRKPFCPICYTTFAEEQEVVRSYHYLYLLFVWILI